MSGLSNLFPRFRQFLAEENLLPEGSAVLVGVSGGMDSIALLHLLWRIGGERRFKLHVIHVHHGLRGEEADADASFVVAQAAALDIGCTVEHVDTPARIASAGCGMEEAARDLRYEVFEDLRLRLGCSLVATGHTADDNAETVLMHLFRGTGVRGLGGIPLRRPQGNVIRPLLFATRDDIRGYVEAEGLAWRTDRTNEQDGTTRNVIRHHVLPPVREAINPDIARTLFQAAGTFRELDAYLEHVARAGLDLVARQDAGGDVHLSLPSLLSFPFLVRHYIAAMAIERYYGTRAGRAQVEALLGLVDLQPGSWTPLGGSVAGTRERDALVLSTRRDDEPFMIAVEPDRTYPVYGHLFSIRSASPPGEPLQAGRQLEYVDAVRTGESGLVLRSRRPADAFFPLGMVGRKKVSDFLTDERISGREKHRYPLLVNSAGEIVWICGLRIDDRFKITPSTRRAWRLSYRRPAQDDNA